MTFEEVIEELPNHITEEVAQAYWDNQPSYWETCDAKDFMDSLEEDYNGIYGSEEAFAEQLVDELGILDNNEYAYYFDYEKFAHDLFLGDYWSENVSSGVAVFRSY